jgi:hypothetical protein
VKVFLRGGDGLLHVALGLVLSPTVPLAPLVSAEGRVLGAKLGRSRPVLDGVGCRG